MEQNTYKATRDYRFSLRTLVIVLAIAPPLLWGAWLAIWYIVAAQPRATFEGLIGLMLLAVAIAVLAGPVRRAIRGINAR